VQETLTGSSLDSHLRTPEEASVIRGSPARTTIVTTGNAPRKKIERWRREGFAF